MDVMEKAAQGDKQAMRLVEKEYGVGNGQDFAIEQLSVEEFPAKVTYAGKVNRPSREYQYDATNQVKNFEKEMFGKKLAELEPSDQKDLLLTLSVLDPKGAAWANIRLNDPVGQETLNMENWTFNNDREYWEELNLSPEAQAVLDYYEEKFEPHRPRGMKGWEWKPLPDAHYPSKFPIVRSYHPYNIEPAFDPFTKETKMVDKKQPLEEKEESPKTYLTEVELEYRNKREKIRKEREEEEERKKKEREELEKLFKSRGL